MNSNNTKEATFTTCMVFASHQRIIQREKDDSSDNKNQMKQRVFFLPFQIAERPIIIDVFPESVENKTSSYADQTGF